jgi:hypothetical protein
MLVETLNKIPFNFDNFRFFMWTIENLKTLSRIFPNIKDIKPLNFFFVFNDTSKKKALYRGPLKHLIDRTVSTVWNTTRFSELWTLNRDFWNVWTEFWETLHTSVSLNLRPRNLAYAWILKFPHTFCKSQGLSYSSAKFPEILRKNFCKSRKFCSTIPKISANQSLSE